MSIDKISQSSQAIQNIKMNSYDVESELKNIEPSEGIFNLNDFYNQGYTSDEKNKEETKAIQQSILDRYSVDENDENAEEKLSVIYDTMLKNQENSALLDFCKENKISTPKSTKDNFIDEVETLMARMSHDGSSIGDEITLGDVDFSEIQPAGIEDSDKNKVIINNSFVIEFDDEIAKDGNVYKGTVLGDNVEIEQKKDDTCIVTYYDGNDEKAEISKQVEYLPNKTTKETLYGTDDTGKSVVTSQIVKDETGSIISEHSDYGDYSIEINRSGETPQVVMYDKNGKIKQYTNAQENDQGILNIETFKDGTTTQSTCIRYQEENGTKFQFDSGNKNAVNFEENENGIEVTISRGSLKTTESVEKNDNGTYSYNGEIYTSPEELAVEFNELELSSSQELDGKIENSKQGFGVGDCGVLSTVNAFSYTQYGRQILDDALEYTDNGDVNVTLKGLNRTYLITKDEIENSTYASGDKDMLAVELALEKGLGEVRQGTIGIGSNKPEYIESTSELWEYEDAITANDPREIMYLISGKAPSNVERAVPDRQTKIAWLDELQNYEGIAINVATFYGDGSTILRTDTDSCYLAAKNGIDAFGNPIEVATEHAYAVKEVNTKSNGERTVTIVNPWDSGNEIVLSENTYIDLFETQYVMQIRDNESYPQLYY